MHGMNMNKKKQPFVILDDSFIVGSGRTRAAAMDDAAKHYSGILVRPKTLHVAKWSRTANGGWGGYELTGDTFSVGPIERR